VTSPVFATPACEIEVRNEVTGEVGRVVSPKSRGEIIEAMLFLDQQKAKEDDDGEDPPLLCSCFHVYPGGPIVLRYFSDRDHQEACREMRRLIESGEAVGTAGAPLEDCHTADPGFPVEVRDEVSGASYLCHVPLPYQVIVESLRDAEARDDSGVEPSPAEIVGHVRPDSITLRFWSPLPPAEAREATAAAIAKWQEAIR
jgi:hypothetical protein